MTRLLQVQFHAPVGLPGTSQTVQKLTYAPEGSTKGDMAEILWDAKEWAVRFKTRDGRWGRTGLSSVKWSAEAPKERKKKESQHPGVSETKLVRLDPEGQA